MQENPSEIPRKSRRPGRLLVATVAAVARLVLIAAGACLLTMLLLLVVWWRLISWPQRHKTPRERSVAQREALLELAGAVGTLLAARKRA